MWLWKVLGKFVYQYQDAYQLLFFVVVVITCNKEELLRVM